MNPAINGTEGSASAPLLYVARELGNKSWRLALATYRNRFTPWRAARSTRTSASARTTDG